MKQEPTTSDAQTRWEWRIRGQVQGVGFRPFVYRVAAAAGVTGRVLNDGQGVLLEVQGDAAALTKFEGADAREMPALARVDSCERREITVAAGETEFVIDYSEIAPPASGDETSVEAAVTIDTAVCSECLRELLAEDGGGAGKRDRRFGHGLINCTNCGPRFSIVRDVPYDRANTTMAGFAMCAECRREYEDPRDRRFHAQPVCCPKCGPQVALVTLEPAKARSGGVRPRRVRKVRGNPFEGAAKLLIEGKVVAVKGLGGFHLAIRADRQEAVARLRKLKRRDAKPFALMCADMAMVRELVRLSDAGAAELASQRAPILLALRNPAASSRVADAVTDPGERSGGWATYTLGVMLPYTPVHHLLWKALRACCGASKERLPALVMTSGNLSSEPLVIDNKDAVERLGGLCDAILWHDRPIERCVDDSVILDRGGSEGGQKGATITNALLPIRRSRGYAPGSWLLPAELRGQGGAGHRTGICLGGELKNTIAVVRDRDIIASQHFGDLTHPLAYAHFRKAIDDLIRLFHVRVDFVTHDLHPNYMSTMAARELAKRFGARLIAVQHHVAHAAGVLAENGVHGRAVAIVRDGTGYGPDETIWGGELLEIEAGGGARWKRLGRLRPMRLPGGDAAAVDTRRSALSLVHAAYGEEFDRTEAAAGLFPDERERKVLARMIRTGFNSPWTSSTGRLFDGVAALLGICQRNDHEAQAAMALEAAAYRWAEPRSHEEREGIRRSEEKAYEVRLNAEAGLWELDLSGFVKRLILERGEQSRVGALAWEFHRNLARGWVDLLVAATEATGRRVGAGCGFSGGVFCNGLLSEEIGEAARRRVYALFFTNHTLRQMQDLHSVRRLFRCGWIDVLTSLV